MSSLIDTSKMSEGQRAALEMAESSRDTRDLSGFAGPLFTGDLDYRKIFPFPAQSEEDRDQGDAFLAKLSSFLEKKTDPDAIDREGEIPEEVIAGLAGLGAFGIKIPTKYGGLGLSQTNYSRAAMLLGAHCGNLTALLSAHQSIGLPQPLIVFGTEAQKKKYLPRCARGGISAFALTEENVGSDPARMETSAELSADGKHWILNGQKLWCTNVLKAEHLIVMARTPQDGKSHATTAFIIETSWPGVEIVRRCHFMGLKALYNGIVRFENVKIPAENIVHEVGKGLRVALTTLNTGRLTLPAACVGLMRRCLELNLRWSGERVQWGQAIGKHAAIAGKLADLAADAFATEAMVLYTSALVDQDKNADIRMEAAMAKLWGTEAAWHSIDETMQIKGGRGYETADSLRARGETPDPVERLLRDCRINLIFEGSSEIMRLFLAREALDPHLKRGAAAIDSRREWPERLSAAAKAGLHYAWWYPSRYLPRPSHKPDELSPELRKCLKIIDRHTAHLSRALLHAMALHGPALEKKQLLLARLVDIGTELFAMATAVSYAHSLRDAQADPLHARARDITRYLCQRGDRRIKSHFRELHKAPDKSGYQLARALLDD
ncbi:MAG: acyl-CoA dehydrogenase family protein [Verrucomicrobiales bacterium]